MSKGIMENKIKYPSGHLKYVQKKLFERDKELVSIPVIHYRIKRGYQDYLDIVAEFVKEHQKSKLNIIAKKEQIKSLMEVI